MSDALYIFSHKYRTSQEFFGCDVKLIIMRVGVCRGNKERGVGIGRGMRGIIGGSACRKAIRNR